MEILKRLFALSFFALLLTGLLCPSADARSSANIQLNARKIEAGLIYNFLKYTNWPTSSFPEYADEIVVCLFGGDPFDGHLDPLEGRTAQQRVITVRKIYQIEQLDACHLVYIPKNRQSDLPRILGRLRNRTVLTVSNIPNFAMHGGMVEFYTGKDQRIHLNINAAAVNSANLRIQDRMVKLAGVVQ